MLRVRNKRFIKAVVGSVLGLSLVMPASAGIAPWDALEPWEGWAEFSDFGTWALPSIAIGIAASKGDYTGLLQLGGGWTGAQLATQGVKKAFPKARPNGWCCQSAASGHTSSAFSAAAFLHHRYGWDYGLPAYAGAALVGYARIKAERHHPEDVLIGAALGIGTSYFLTNSYAPDEFRIEPTVTDDGGYGIELKWPW